MHAPSPTRSRPSPVLLGPLLAAPLLAVALSCIGSRPRPRSTTLGGCVPCHEDAADQLAGALHEKAGIGCVTCHGYSRSHVRDGSDHVKPDHTFAGYDIDDLCNTCHVNTCPHSQADRPFTPARRTCADCHGAHAARLPDTRRARARRERQSGRSRW